MGISHSLASSLKTIAVAPLYKWRARVGGQSAEEFLRLWIDGYKVGDKRDRLVVSLDPIREIFPVATDFNRSQRRLLLRSGFQFTSNQCFDRVAERCATKKPDVWIGQRSRKFLSELYEQGKAHSFEIYKEGQLVGGLIGIAVGNVFIGLSVYRECSGAGNAAFMAMNAVLERGGFEWVDAIDPSPLSRRFGGRVVSTDDFRFLLSEAVKKRADVATYTEPQPLAPFAIRERHDPGSPFFNQPSKTDKLPQRPTLESQLSGYPYG